MTSVFQWGEEGNQAERKTKNRGSTMLGMEMPARAGGGVQVNCGAQGRDTGHFICFPLR